MTYPIDLVYLWCSDTEKNFRHRQIEAKKKFYIPYENERADRRTTDHSELRYSLRSVEKFAPWVRFIYIVTDRQVPNWLNLDHPKIKIIDHSEIIPHELLPTFNSAVIEAFIHKIDGLSEHFLYANDDMFFFAKTDPDFFFTEDGKPIHYIQFMDEYSSSYWSKLLKRGKTLAEKDTDRKILKPASPSHNIDPYTKSLYADTVQHFWKNYQEILPNKFRKDNDVQRFLVSCWGHLTDRLVWKNIEKEKVAYLDKIDAKILNDFLSKPMPNLCCLNDSDFLDNSDYYYHAELLKKLFSNKSDFEINDVIPDVQYDSSFKPAFDKKNIPIVFVINEEFFPYFIVTLTSLLKHTSPEYNYDIILLYEHIGQEMLKILDSVELPENAKVRTQDIFPFLKKYREKNFSGFPPVKIIKWAKIFLPKLLSGYSKIIYLDSDLLLNCDIAELFHTNLKDQLAAAVLDMAAHDLNNPKAEHMHDAFRCNNIDDYINLGVMVLNLEALREYNFTEKVLDLMTSIPPNMWNLYDFFNALLHDHILLLPMTYNLQYGISFKNPIYPFFKNELCLEYQSTLEKGPKIMHFTGIKPWFKAIGPGSLKFWEVAKQTNVYEMILLAPKGIPIKEPSSPPPKK